MTDAAIASVRGRRVWDSRGRPTVEAEVGLASGARGRAIAPAGASRGAHEAIDLRDGGARLGGMDVGAAVANVNGAIARALAGMDARDQARGRRRARGARRHARTGRGSAATRRPRCRSRCCTPPPRTRGCPSTASSGPGPIRLPLPEIQIFGGGAHAGRRVDVQDFMVMALGAASFAQALEMTAEVYRAAGELMRDAGKLAGVADEGGWWPAFDTNDEALDWLVRAIERAGFTPGDEVAISLDIAASEFGRNGRYRLGLEGRELDSDAMGEMLERWLARYPIVSIEDPLAEDDGDGLARFTRAVGDRVQVIGDDFLVTNAARVAAAAARGACNAVLVKPNQAGTVTDARAALEAGKRAQWGTIVSARSGETEDVSIAHLAVGWDAGQLKVGSFARSERMAKWNEVLRIEEAEGANARFAGRAALPQFRAGRGPRPPSPPNPGERAG